MARTPKTIEDIITKEIMYFNETHKVPERLADDCNQEIALAVFNAYTKNVDTAGTWISMAIRSAATKAGERFINAEKLHESRLSHAKDDDEFLWQLACSRVKHAAVCDVLNAAIKELVNKTGFTERESKVILMVLEDPNGETTFKEIGEILGVSDNRARQIYVKILRKFRNPRRSKILLDYFDML